MSRVNETNADATAIFKNKEGKCITVFAKLDEEQEAIDLSIDFEDGAKNHKGLHVWMYETLIEKFNP